MLSEGKDQDKESDWIEDLEKELEEELRSDVTKEILRDLEKESQVDLVAEFDKEYLSQQARARRAKETFEKLSGIWFLGFVITFSFGVMGGGRIIESISLFFTWVFGAYTLVFFIPWVVSLGRMVHENDPDIPLRYLGYVDVRKLSPQDRVTYQLMLDQTRRKSKGFSEGELELIRMWLRKAGRPPPNLEELKGGLRLS